MLFDDLKIREVYATFSDLEIIKDMMKTGLETGCPQLAVSAMEEFIVRNRSDIVRDELGIAFRRGYAKVGTPMRTTIARSLVECKTDPFLKKFGDFLLVSKTDDPITEFANYIEKTMAEEDKDFLRFLNLEWSQTI